MAEKVLSAGATSSREDVEFLREQVQRLSAVLSQYQKKYLPLSPEDGVTLLAADGPHASWLTNKRMLAPLLTEYDNSIGELNQQISTYQSEVESLVSRVQQITQENTRLHSELRKSLEAQLQAATGEATSSTEASAAVQALHHQLEVLSKERDSYIDLWKQTSQELEAVQKSEQQKVRELLKCKTELATVQQAAVSAQQGLDELQSTCQKLNEERQECLQAAHSQEQELSSLQEALGQCRTELKAANIKNSELKKSLDEITLQLKKRELQRQKMEGHEQSLDDRVHLMHITNADLEGKLLVVQREAALLKGEKADLEGRLSTLQSKMTSLEQREYEAILHVKESMQLVENAILEKEQAQIQEQQQVQEVGRLKKAIATLLQEAGERTRREVASVREECNKNIDKMAEEIEKLEQECSERQVQVERALREKKMVEKELERVVAQGPLEHTQAGETLYELQKRACVAERARDEATIKLENTVATLRRLETRLLEDRKEGEKVAEEHRKWKQRMEEECQQLREQRLTSAGQCDELQQRLRASEKAREAAERRLDKEVAVLAQRHALHEKELLFRLEVSEETHWKSVQELRELLTAQHRVGTRWREESKTLTQKFEHTIAELRNEMTKHKRRSEELMVQVNTLKLSKEELSKQLTRTAAAHSSLQQQLGEAESHVEEATSQLAVLLSREKQLLQERRNLHQQLDKLRLEMARNAWLHLNAPGGIPNPSKVTASVLRNSSLPPTTHALHPPTLDTSRWDGALSGLQHSIHQVRQDLGLEGTGVREEHPRTSRASRRSHHSHHSRHSHHSHHSRSRSPGTPSPRHSSLENEEEESSTLLRGELSQTSSHRNLTPP